MKFRTCALGLLGSLLALPVSAQEVDRAQLRQEVNLLAGVVEEALDLNQSSGLFGINSGGVTGSYLHGQGVLLEINSPLANERNRLQLASLTNIMRGLAERSNPFETRSVTASANPAVPGASDADSADSFYDAMMSRIAEIDFSLVVNSALQQANEAARSLRSIGELEDGDYAQVRENIEELRRRMQQNLAEMSAFESSLRGSDSAVADRAENVERAASPAADGSAQDLSQRFESLMAGIEPLRSEALRLADDLKSRSEAAEARFRENWQARLVTFEQELYQALCDFGASLRSLPEDEYVSILLRGLGENNEANSRADKVHVLAKTDIMSCQSGAIDNAALLDRGVQYSY